jgi:hypothetical protein
MICQQQISSTVGDRSITQIPVDVFSRTDRFTGRVVLMTTNVGDRDLVQPSQLEFGDLL